MLMKPTKYLRLQCSDTVGWAAGRAWPEKTDWLWASVVICLKRGADLHMVQLMPLPLTVSCFSKIQIGFTFLVPAYPGSPGRRVVMSVCIHSNQIKIVRNSPIGIIGPMAIGIGGIPGIIGMGINPGGGIGTAGVVVG